MLVAVRKVSRAHQFDLLQALRAPFSRPRQSNSITSESGVVDASAENVSRQIGSEGQISNVERRADCTAVDDGKVEASKSGPSSTTASSLEPVQSARNPSLSGHGVCKATTEGTTQQSHVSSDATTTPRCCTVSTTTTPDNQNADNDIRPETVQIPQDHQGQLESVATSSASPAQLPTATATDAELGLHVCNAVVLSTPFNDGQSRDSIQVTDTSSDADLRSGSASTAITSASSTQHSDTSNPQQSTGQHQVKPQNTACPTPFPSVNILSPDMIPTSRPTYELVPAKNLSRNREGLYIADPRLHLVPGSIRNEWEKEHAIRLTHDLQSIRSKLPRSLSHADRRIEFELRMIGRTVDQHVNVELRPTIWIRCGSSKCKKAVRKAIAYLDYPHDFTGGAIHIGLHAPSLAAWKMGSIVALVLGALGGLMAIALACYSWARKWRYRRWKSSRTDIHLQHQPEDLETGPLDVTVPHSANLRQPKYSRNASPVVVSRLALQHDRQFRLVIEGISYSKVCGMKLTSAPAPDGADMAISTIGGLILVDNKLYGLTTGHQFMMDEPLPSTAEMERLDSCSLSSESDLSVHGYCINHDSDDEPGHVTYAASLWPSRHLISTIARPRLDRVVFADCGSQSPNHADFALIELEFGSEVRPWNTYLDADYLDHDIWSFGELEAQAPGTVFIVGHSKFAIEGYLLEGTSVFLYRDAAFSTRKIQTQKCLPRGFSGAWVVRDDTLLGYILAVYENEPFAHVLPITEVMYQVKVLTGAKEVVLPSLEGTEKPTSSDGPSHLSSGESRSGWSSTMS